MSKTWRALLYFGFFLRVVGFIQEWQTFPFRSSPFSLIGYGIIAFCMAALIGTLDRMDREEQEQDTED